jgi:hypothetical protein
MLGGVPIRRLVAAADVAAGPAEPQMYPFRATFQTFLASTSAWRHDADRVLVTTSIGHLCLRRVISMIACAYARSLRGHLALRTGAAIAMGVSQLRSAPLRMHNTAVPLHIASSTIKPLKTLLRNNRPLRFSAAAHYRSIISVLSLINHRTLGLFHSYERAGNWRPSGGDRRLRRNFTAFASLGSARAPLACAL